MNLRVLLVEDNIDLANSILEFFALKNIIHDFAGNGNTGLSLACSNVYDVVVLDVNLPGINGLKVCSQLRLKGNDVPVLMLTARDTLSDKLEGFDSGADDYLVKPFALSELLARIYSLSKRKSGLSKCFKVDDLEMNIQTKTVTRGGEKLELTPICWTILEVLMRNSPNLVPKEALLVAIWGEEQPDSDNLKVHIHKLRHVLGQGATLIHTIRGHGFAIREQ
ncbi:MAG: DNA-binding response OmpR family regulator [Flavobacteriales bacterium]|jgi:DNA-binding response OmpR family regulator